MQQSRLDKAKLIIDRPGDFKVCEACGSIVSPDYGSVSQLQRLPF